MKALVCAAAFLAALASARAATPATAQVWMVCLSLRFQPAVANSLGGESRLSLTTGVDPNSPNGELAPTFDPQAPSHFSRFILLNPVFPEPLLGNLALNAPMDIDEDNDGFPDLIELDQAVPSTTTAGLYNTAVDQGVISAVWSREAGSLTGSCRLKLRSDQFGELETFNATFELLRYAGTLEYTRSSSNAVAAVSLGKPDDPANAITGSMLLTRVETNRFDQLTLAPGTLTNKSQQVFRFTDATIPRDTFSKTNYFTILDFEDGEPATSELDYPSWQLSIDDPNDADRDGIPDLSDDLPGSEVKPPRLNLARVGDRLRLEIAGETGRTYDLEEAAILGRDWTKTQAINLTNTLQTVELPLPAELARFWRLRSR